MPTGVLALDFAIRTGWALFWPDAEDAEIWHLDAGCLHLGERGGASGAVDNGRRLSAFERFLTEKIEAGGVSLLGYENVLPRHVNSGQSRLSNGLRAIVEKVSVDYMLELFPVHNMTLKKWATGNGRAEKSDMIATAFERWGADPNWCKLIEPVENEIDDNTVDAMWVLNWLVHNQTAYKSCSSPMWKLLGLRPGDSCKSFSENMLQLAPERSPAGEGLPGAALEPKKKKKKRRGRSLVRPDHSGQTFFWTAPDLPNGILI